jgi:nitrile hydratase beta subunit
MNGIHDVGGMQGMGPIRYEKDEPVFHAEWEGRVVAMNAAAMKGGGPRRGIELYVPAAEYLRMSYYEKWLTSLTGRLVAAGLVTKAEIESGRPAEGPAKSVPAISPAEAPAFLAKVVSTRRNVPVSARFQMGQHVRARNINPVGYTRLPRYARGKFGTINRDHGVFVFGDTVGTPLGEKPQHVYSVRFSARELWGDDAIPQDAVYIDMWDDYLEPA